MKFTSSILAICILQANLLTTTSFVVNAPKSHLPVSLHSSTTGNEGTTTRQTVKQSAAAPFATRETTNALAKANKSTTNKNTEPTSKPENIWETNAAMTVQGGSLRTWSIADGTVDKVQVYMKTEGRPLNADLELWQGPDNTPLRLGVYIEDGEFRPFSAVIDTPASQNAIAIRNTGYIEFPMDAALSAQVDDDIIDTSNVVGRIVQGGAVYTTPFEGSVSAVLVVLKTDGRPMNCRIELLQGPNNRKQVMELYSEDGMHRPFVAVIETPGAGNVVRIQNTDTIEFPLNAHVVPYRVDTPGGYGDGSDAFIVN